MYCQKEINQKSLKKKMKVIENDSNTLIKINDTNDNVFVIV